MASGRSGETNPPPLLLFDGIPERRLFIPINFEGYIDTSPSNSPMTKKAIRGSNGLRGSTSPLF